jgi:hypothetical protein
MMQLLHSLKMYLQRLQQAGRQHCYSAFLAFRIANDQLVLSKINVLNSQLQAFTQPQPAAIQQLNYQFMNTEQTRDDLLNFMRSQYCGQVA